jgi:large repetitive protein
VAVRLQRTPGPEREGASDTTLVTHEWGHYLHHRLVGGCASTQCASISEGWGDFVALHQLLRQGDKLDGTYPISAYAGAATVEAPYFGIRRAPYSIDQTKNGLTFRHIGEGEALPSHPLSIFAVENNEIHNAGEIWAAMMFEAYIALQQSGRPFEEVRRDMSDIVVLGLAMTPFDATFTEQRDAILSAAASGSTDDFTRMAGGFARRGAGTCAVSPARDSDTLTGVVEDFDVSPVIVLGAVASTDASGSCDSDGILDAGEFGKLAVSIGNGGAAPLADGRLTVTTSTPGVTLDERTTNVASIAPLTWGQANLDFSLDASFPQQGVIDLNITFQSASSCVTQAVQVTGLRVNYDDQANASATDDFDSTNVVWTASGSGGDEVWTQVAETTTRTVLHGADSEFPSDTAVESPSVMVGTGAFSVAIRHAYTFESDAQADYDGGVIELSDDNGATWADVSTLGANPGYTGSLTDTSGNPLGGRAAYSGTSAGVTTTLSFGTQFSGQTVKLRFRIATDAAVGEAGWSIDSVAFTGITNTPFNRLADDATTCVVAPPVDAGVGSPDAAPGTPDSGVGPGDPDSGVGPGDPDSGVGPIRPDAGGTGGGDDDGGCGCRVGDDTSGPPGPLGGALLLLGAAVVLVRRRRR